MRHRLGGRLPALLVALAAVLPAPARAAVYACNLPRCVDTAVPDSYGATVPDRHVRVLLPTGYDPNGTAQYPVLYLLHGAGDTYKTWTDNTDVDSFTAGMNLIIVMPDGGHNGSSNPTNEAGWYSNWFDGSRQWEQFQSEALVAWTDVTYRTLGDGHRAVAGLSMGGFGAMHAAALHPGEFAAAASFSGAVDTMLGFPANGAAFKIVHDQFGTPDDRVWGNQVTQEANWRANNPADQAAHLAGTALFIATGNGAPGGPHEDPSNPGGYMVESVVYAMNVSFARALDSAGVLHTDWFYGPGQHSWPYWQDALHWALPKMVPAFD